MRVLKGKMEDYMRHALLVLATLGLAQIACADGYVTLQSNNSTSTGFAGATWSETVADPSTRDYLVNNSRIFYTTSGETINAHSLTFGEVGGSACTFFSYYSATFNNEGVIFANGEAYLRASDVNLSGKTTFTSPESAPFRFHGTYYRPKGYTFKGDVHSASGNGILTYSQGTNGFFVAFQGDTSDYLGSVVITSQYDRTGAPWGAELRLSGSASYFGGSITVRDGATFKPQIATSVGSLTLDEGASLSLTAGNTLTVRTALAVNGGPVSVTLSGAPTTTVGEHTRYALIAMPANSPCTETDFDLPNAGSDRYTAPHLYMETVGDVKTLYAAYYPIVTITKKNNGSNGNTATGSAVTNGTYWSDGEPVHGLAHYQVSRLNSTTDLMTPYAPGETMVFPGVSLQMGGNTILNIRSSAYTISNLWLSCGSSGTSMYSLNNEETTLRGNFSVNGTVSFAQRLSGLLQMAGPMTGTEGSLLLICGAAAGTSQCRGIVMLDGDNSGYLGKITVSIDYPKNVAFGSQFMSLRVSDAASLGGPRSEFTYDALKIEHAGRLEAYGSFTMEEPTRGVFVSGQGRFFVRSGETLTLKEQLTANGRVYKEGLGTLAIGGPLQFLDSVGALTDAAPADATNRTFFVTAGTLKPIGARSLDGLDVVFSNVTSHSSVALRFDAAPQDVEMQEFGAINLKASAPFATVIENGGKVPVSFDMPENAAQQYDVALFTVDASAANGIVSALDIPEKFVSGDKKYRVTVSQRAATVDGSPAVTIVATVAERVPRGMVISLQ